LTGAGLWNSCWGGLQDASNTGKASKQINCLTMVGCFLHYHLHGVNPAICQIENMANALKNSDLSICDKMGPS
jgi:hypothetical protein